MANSKKQPKTLLDKIIYAIRNQSSTSTSTNTNTSTTTLNKNGNPNGVSRIAIIKYLQNEFDFDKEKKSALFQNALKKGLKTSKLIQTGRQSFRVAGDPIPETTSEPKLKIVDLQMGDVDGPEATVGDTVIMKYKGKLTDENGSIFDSASSFEFVLGAGEVIKGWDEGILSMKVGGKRELYIPSKLAYGKRGSPPDIPPNSDLYFHVTLKKIK